MSCMTPDVMAFIERMAEKHGMQWMVVVACLWILKSELMTIAKSQAAMAETLKHIADHLTGQEHNHDKPK